MWAGERHLQLSGEYMFKCLKGSKNMRNKSFFYKFISHITLVAYLFSYFQPSLLMASDADLGLEMSHVGPVVGINGDEDRFGDADREDIRKNVQKVEKGWKWLCTWATLQTCCTRLGLGLTTNKSSVNDIPESWCDPLLLRGSPIPLKDPSAVSRTIVTQTMFKAFEESVLMSLHTVLTVLLFYQLSAAKDRNVYEVYREADRITVLGFIANPELFTLCAFPFIWSLFRSVLSYFLIKEPTHNVVAGYMKAYKNFSKESWWDLELLNFLTQLPVVSVPISLVNTVFHPGKDAIQNLGKLVHYDGRLSLEDLNSACDVIFDAVKNARGATQLAAIEKAYQLAAMNLADLDKALTNAEESRNEKLIELRKAHLQMKFKAIVALKEAFETIPPWNVNKTLAGIRLWEIAQNDSKVIRVAEPVIKAGRLATYIILLVGIIDAVKAFLKCVGVYENSFNWKQGLDADAYDLPEPCLNAIIANFGKIPGQDPNEVVNKLGAFKLPNGYDLDLSGKGLPGGDIATIVEGFRDNGIAINSLKIAGNNVVEPDAVRRILAALPAGVRLIDMADNGYGAASAGSSATTVEQNIAFQGLARLTGLKVLTLSNNWLGGNCVGVVGDSLRGIALEELWLDTTFPGLNITQLTLGPSYRVVNLGGNAVAGGLFSPYFNNFVRNSLVNSPNIKWLNLNNAYLGKTENVTIGVLAEGLAALPWLEYLDLGDNPSLGLRPDDNTVKLLQSIPPSVTTLLLGGNSIGKFAQDAEALEKAVSNPGLTTVDVHGNPLGNYTNLFDALTGNTALTSLDASGCGLKNTAALVQFLKQAFGLQELYVSDNLLTDGTLLADPLSALVKLVQVTFGGNNFTTSDRLALLAVKPESFPWDEDAEATKFAINQLPSSTQFFNVRGKVQKNPDFFTVIFETARQLFTGLTGVDISDNVISVLNTTKNGTMTIYETRVAGTQAITDFLKSPNANGLESFTMENVRYSYYYNEWPIRDAFYESIGDAENLKTLSSAGTRFLNCTSPTIGLSKLRFLTDVNIDSSFSGCKDLDPVFKSLRSSSGIKRLIIPNNFIGYYGPDATNALSESISYWPELEEFDASRNFIGRTDAVSASNCLRVVAEQATHMNDKGIKMRVAFVGGIQNISGNEASDALAKIDTEGVQNFCNEGICNGDLSQTSVVPSQTAAPPPPQTSAASPRLQPPFHSWIRGATGFVKDATSQVGNRLGEVVSYWYESPVLPQFQSTIPVIHDGVQEMSLVGSSRGLATQSPPNLALALPLCVTLCLIEVLWKKTGLTGVQDRMTAAVSSWTTRLGKAVGYYKEDADTSPMHHYKYTYIDDLTPKSKASQKLTIRQFGSNLVEFIVTIWLTVLLNSVFSNAYGLITNDGQ